MFAHGQNEKYDEVTKQFEEWTVQQLIDKQESNMFELNSSVRQATLAFLCEFVGACYVKQKLFDKAIRTWKRSLIFQRKARLEQLLLGTTDNNSSTLTRAQESLISKSYQLAREHYLKLIKETNEPKDETIKPLPYDFCLGFLYAESYNRDRAIEYLTKTTTSSQKSDHDILFAVYLLLADMFKHQHEYEKSIENFDQALKSLKSLESQKDRVLEIEIKLARIDCLIKTDQNDEVITKLETLRKSLKSNDTDTKRISLKVIIYDTLARYFSMQKNYKLFDSNAEESLALKLRCFSQYHPSLTISLILMAERHTQERRYREALDFYEHALEVQSLNLTDKHQKIRKICYAIGDIYCELDKLPNAMEKYNVAENKSLDVDEDDVLQQETTSLEESMEILMARISMHQHLAEYHSRKQAYKEAISEMNKIINLLEKKLPSSTFDINDETKIRETNDFEDTNILELADSYFQCALLYDQLSLHLKSIVSYISAFAIYASKSLSKIEILISEATNIINSFTGDGLKPKDILEIYKRLLPSEDVIQTCLKIAAMYRENEMDDVKDLDDDDDTSNESREIAVEWYRDCLYATDDVLAKGVCYYNILSVYKNFIYEDDDGKAIVDDMINCLPKFNSSDRRLLITLALHFLKEYDNNKGYCDRKSILQLQKVANHSFDEKLKMDNASNIGYYLMKSNDLVSAEEYWSSIAKQLECDIAGPVLPLLHDSIQLTASEIDKTLVDDIRTKVEECSPSGRAVLLAQYLMELGEYRAVRKYLSSLLTQACDGGILVNDPNLAAIYCCLGMTYARQGLHSDALKAFKQALNVQARVEYSNNNALANIHNNIGLAYIGLDHMDEAEETLAKALRIQLREVNSNQQHLASIYGNIGYVHYKKNDFEKALDGF
ncbi:unnamed protein product, partial [Rotaria sp. Silwood1]